MREQLNIAIRVFVATCTFIGIFLFGIAMTHDNVLSLTSAVVFVALDIVVMDPKKHES